MMCKIAKLSYVAGAEIPTKYVTSGNQGTC